MNDPLIILFASSLLAATILPAQSEIVLTSIYLTGEHSSAILLAVATFGNVLGASVNWALGRYLMHFKDRKWFPIKDRAIDKSTKYFQKYGVWTLLFAWLPVIGDPLTLIAGVLKTNILLFVIFVTIGKAARYAALLYIL